MTFRGGEEPATNVETGSGPPEMISLQRRGRAENRQQPSLPSSSRSTSRGRSASRGRSTSRARSTSRSRGQQIVFPDDDPLKILHAARRSSSILLFDRQFLPREPDNLQNEKAISSKLSEQQSTTRTGSQQESQSTHSTPPSKSVPSHVAVTDASRNSSISVSHVGRSSLAVEKEGEKNFTTDSRPIKLAQPGLAVEKEAEKNIATDSRPLNLAQSGLAQLDNTAPFGTSLQRDDPGVVIVNPSPTLVPPKVQPIKRRSIFGSMFNRPNNRNNRSASSDEQFMPSGPGYYSDSKGETDTNEGLSAKLTPRTLELPTEQQDAKPLTPPPLSLTTLTAFPSESERKSHIEREPSCQLQDSAAMEGDNVKDRDIILELLTAESEPETAEEQTFEVTNDDTPEDPLFPMLYNAAMLLSNSHRYREAPAESQCIHDPISPILRTFGFDHFTNFFGGNNNGSGTSSQQQSKQQELPQEQYRETSPSPLPVADDAKLNPSTNKPPENSPVFDIDLDTSLSDDDMLLENVEVSRISSKENIQACRLLDCRSSSSQARKEARAGDRFQLEKVLAAVEAEYTAQLVMDQSGHIEKLTREESLLLEVWRRQKSAQPAPQISKTTEGSSGKEQRRSSPPTSLISVFQPTISRSGELAQFTSKPSLAVPSQAQSATVDNTGNQAPVKTDCHKPSLLAQSLETNEAKAENTGNQAPIKTGSPMLSLPLRSLQMNETAKTGNTGSNQAPTKACSPKSSLLMKSLQTNEAAVTKVDNTGNQDPVKTGPPKLSLPRQSVQTNETAKVENSGNQAPIQTVSSKPSVLVQSLQTNETVVVNRESFTPGRRKDQTKLMPTVTDKHTGKEDKSTQDKQKLKPREKTDKPAVAKRAPPTKQPFRTRPLLEKNQRSQPEIVYVKASGWEVNKREISAHQESKGKLQATPLTTERSTNQREGSNDYFHASQAAATGRRLQEDQAQAQFKQTEPKRQESQVGLVSCTTSWTKNHAGAAARVIYTRNLPLENNRLERESTKSSKNTAFSFDLAMESYSAWTLDHDSPDVDQYKSFHQSDMDELTWGFTKNSGAKSEHGDRFEQRVPSKLPYPREHLRDTRTNRHNRSKLSADSAKRLAERHGGVLAESGKEESLSVYHDKVQEASFSIRPFGAFPS